LTISNSTLSTNSAFSDGGGIYNNGGTLTISNSTLSTNSAFSGGGGIYNAGTLTLTSSTLSGNSTTGSSVGKGGGSIYNAGTLTLINSTISNSLARYGSRNGGAIYNAGVAAITHSTLFNNSSSGAGGGIYNTGTVTLTQSALSSNTTMHMGGGIYNDTGGTITVTNSTISGNSTQSIGEGGGIYNTGTVTLTSSTISGNSATERGGGIFNNADGIIVLAYSTLSGNSVPGKEGSSIFNTTMGTVTITNSTLSGNSASNGNIYNFGAVSISNSTFSDNSAGRGSAITNNGSGMVTVTNSTFSGNLGFNGGTIHNYSGTVTLNNTLIGKGAQDDNCYGTISSNGAAYNLSDDNTCGAGVTEVASLGLGTLGANGGATQTIPLLAGSPAIDAALAANCPATDQRGFIRPAGASCDIGAFEYGAVPPTDPVPTAIPSPALCSLTGFTSSTQVAMSLPNDANGLNVCYSLLTEPAQAGVTQPFSLAADVYTFDGYGSVTTSVAVQVCLQGAGTLLFRDASGQPRITVNLPSFSQNGFTCGLIPNAGTVILIPGAPAPAAAIPPTALSNCRVTTTHILNLRAAPDATSAVLTLVPYQTTLNASARSGAWLQVVFGSQQGWLSAGYLMLDGDCG